MWHRRTLLAAVTGLAGCVGSSTPSTPEGPAGTPTRPPAGARYAFTHLRPDGNRVVDVAVDGRPA